MDHMKMHANPSAESNTGDHQCRYCLAILPKSETFDKHCQVNHPVETKEGTGSYNCVICWVSLTEFTIHLL